MKILIGGGSGLIGQQLIDFYKNSEITVLTRNPNKTFPKNCKKLIWDGKTIPEISGSFDVLINLSGAGIADKAWTESYKKAIIDSRENTSQAFVTFIEQSEQKAKIFINASAVGFYGFGTSKIVDEDSPLGNDFLAEVSEKWENAARNDFVRTVLLRTSVVLSAEGGALRKMLLPFKLFLGGKVGSGKQAFPWIHIDDEIRAIDFCIQNQDIVGAVNLVSPKIIDNKQFTKSLAKSLKVFAIFPVPGFILKIVLGERAKLLLKGQKVKPKKLLENGFEFKYPEISKALNNLLQ